MNIKDLREAGIVQSTTKEVKFSHDGKDYEFVAKQVGYIASQNIALRGERGENVLSLLVAESITDKEGNKFTYSEVENMQRDVAEVLLQATLDVNKREEEKKS